MSRHRSVVGIASFESRHEAGRLLAHVLDEAEVVPVLSLLNREATKQLRCKWELTVVPGASHLFEEVGALEGVAELAAAWFTSHLPLPRP